MKSHYIAAIALIVIGLLFLANNLGVAHLNLGQLIAHWWPALLVGLGIMMLFSKR